MRTMHRATIHAVAVGLCLQPLCALAHARPEAPRRTPKLLYIGIDGLRSDAMEVADTPNLAWLRMNGVYAPDAQCEDLTFSGPNWSTILHGVHRDRHNVTTNDYRRARLDQFPDLFARLEAHDPSLNTARLVTWDAIQKFQPTGADLALYHDYEDNGDEVMTAAAVDLLEGDHPEQKGDIDALFLYLGDVDVAGHAAGFHPESGTYRDAIARADRQVGLVLETMRARPGILGESWLVIVTSDHGGSADGQHAGGTYEKRTIPFIVWGTDVEPHRPFPQPKNVDGIRTALAHMGVPPEAMADLDGNVVGLVPVTAPAPAFDVNLIFNGDGEGDRGFPDATFDQAVSGWLDPGPNGVTIVPYGAGEYPTQADPGPETRGRNFFCAGSSAEASMSQIIDLTPLRQAIDAGEVSFELSGWLGGYLHQADHAVVRAKFMSDAGRELLVAEIGPVTPQDRAGRTGLLEREAVGELPRGVRRVEVVLSMARAEGSANDGYADDLSLILRRTPR